ncbi:baseplate J/gp47 family protein [uncultured Sphingomonas sp.]|uniref:baseplate assembly protein n=1 Tax=uncultured Sphingomonas sp. TaxID=158754 RepID=UPI0025E3B0D2|nr:baseplate J/gp47 family protein [uncultured Sphingomonas sp.]
MAANPSTTVDLSRLDRPTIVAPVDYEATLARMIARVKMVMPSFDATVDSDPVMKILQVVAYFQMLDQQDFNERIVSRLVAYATGSTLDHIGAAIGVVRLVLTPANPATGASAVMEADDDLRARIVLGPEKFAAAGPELAYVAHAKDASAQVLDASATSPAPGEVRITILSRQGDGTASADLLAAVRAIVTDPAVRPLGDLVTVATAALLPFEVTAKIWTYSGPDAPLVLATARASLDTYLSRSHRLGRDITLSGLYAALTVEGVQRVELMAPTANIVCDATQAARCTKITVTHAGYDE